MYILFRDKALNVYDCKFRPSFDQNPRWVSAFWAFPIPKNHPRISASDPVKTDGLLPPIQSPTHQKRSLKYPASVPYWEHHWHQIQRLELEPASFDAGISWRSNTWRFRILSKWIMDSNQGYNLYKCAICPLTRVINLHKPTYNQLLSILNLQVCKVGYGSIHSDVTPFHMLV